MDNQVFSVKPSMKLLYIEAFKDLGFFIVLEILLLLLEGWASNVSWLSWLGKAFYTISFVLLIIIGIMILKEWLRLSTTYFTLNENSFVTQKGFFSIKRENLELSRIVDISSSESFIERLFSLGTITLRTIDKSDPIIVMRGLENYKDLEAQIKEYASKKRPTVIEAFKGTETHNIDTVAVDD